MALPRMGEFSFKHSTQPDKPSMTANQLKAAFDTQGNELKIVINAIVDALEKITSTSGAGQIGSEAITDLVGSTIRDQLVDFRNKLKSAVDGSSGADFINATGIAGIAGTTVQSILESLKSYIENLVNTHKSELSSTVAGSSGTEIIGSASITGVTGSTAYAQLVDLKAQINAAVTGQIPDQSITPQKLSFNPAVYPYGVAVGSPNIYGVTLSPAPTSYVDGMAVTVKINVDSTAASTLNVNGLGGIPLKKSNGADITNLKANGIYTFRYNFSTGNFILQGEGGSGNATAGDILSGKSASTDVGDIVGTMPDNGAWNATPGASAITVPAGKHSGAGKVAAVAVPVANVLAGTSIAGQAGTMPNRGNVGAISLAAQNQQYAIPQGYHNGNGIVTATYAAGKPYATGNVTSSTNSQQYYVSYNNGTNYNNTATWYYVSVSGLNFPNGIRAIRILVKFGNQVYVTEWFADELIKFNNYSMHAINSFSYGSGYQGGSLFTSDIGTAMIVTNTGFSNLPVNGSGTLCTYEVWGN